MMSCRDHLNMSKEDCELLKHLQSNITDGQKNRKTISISTYWPRVEVGILALKFTIFLLYTILTAYIPTYKVMFLYMTGKMH